jgi:hypothetical protein
MIARIVIEREPDDPPMGEEELANATCNISMLAETCVAAIVESPLGWCIWKQYVADLEHRQDPAGDFWLSTDVTRGNLTMVLMALDRGHDTMTCRTEEEQEQTT